MTKRGRRPRGHTPMPSTTITALVEELTFLIAIGDGAASMGVQKVIGRLVELDEEAAESYKQATWMRDRAEEELKKQHSGDLKQTDVYKHISANYYRLVDEWKAAQGVAG